MKCFFPIALCVILLSACSPTSAALDVGMDADQHTATGVEVQVTPTIDPIINSIKINFDAGSHAVKYTCETCHTSVDGVIQKDLIWFNESTGQAELVPTPSEMCGKCHASQDTTGSMADAAQFAHSDYECTGCHDAHNPQASCTQSACHIDIRDTIYAQVEKPEGHPTEGDPRGYMCGGTACHDLAKQALAAPIYHQPTHRQVACYGCHDSSGMTVVRQEDQSWVTVAEIAQGDGTQPAVFSHVIGREVVCQKCHAEENAWNLIEILPQN